MTTDNPPVADDRSSEGEAASRRARNRQERIHRFLVSAAELIDAHGLEGLTMAAVAESAECAVGTIYTYFPSKSALVAEMQRRAVESLHEVAKEAERAWDEALAGKRYKDVDEATAALVRLVAYGRLLILMPKLRPREYQLQTQIMTMRGTVEELEDALGVVPTVLAALDQPRRMLDDALEAKALDHPGPGGSSLERMLRWMAATFSMLLLTPAERVVPDLVNVNTLAERTLLDLLTAWGADSDRLDAAVAVCGRLTKDGVLESV